MKDIIARLRELHTDWEKYEKREPHEPQPYSDQIAEALPQLLDRLEKLEAVADAHKAFVAYCEDRFTWSAKPGEWEYMSDEIELKHARDALATPEQVK